MKCDSCKGEGRRYVQGAVVQGQDYGPSESGSYERCWKCNGSGEMPPYDMSEQEVLDILGKAKAVIVDSHIVYTSGKHGSAYVNKDAVYPHTEDTSRLCRAIAERFRNEDVEVVIGPVVGGVILSTWTANHLTRFTGREVLSTYADKVDDDYFVIKRGYDKLIAGKRVLAVEDLLNTGDSAKKVIDAVKKVGGIIVGLGVFGNRGGVTAEYVEVPRLEALVNVKLDAWDAKDCPLCKQNVPINTDVGHGRSFLAQKNP